MSNELVKIPFLWFSELYASLNIINILNFYAYECFMGCGFRLALDVLGIG